MVKPFGTRELMARIRAVLRRASPDARKVVHFSENEVDFERRIVTRKGEELKLTPAEYNLLCYFLHNPDRPLTRDMILNSVWGYEFFPEYPNGGRPRGETAPEAGAGCQQPAPFPYRAWRGVPVYSLILPAPPECLLNLQLSPAPATSITVE